MIHGTDRDKLHRTKLVVLRLYGAVEMRMARYTFSYDQTRINIDTGLNSPRSIADNTFVDQMHFQDKLYYTYMPSLLWDLLPVYDLDGNFQYYRDKRQKIYARTNLARTSVIKGT